jgi:hypothetical protein
VERAFVLLLVSLIVLLCFVGRLRKRQFGQNLQNEQNGMQAFCYCVHSVHVSVPIVFKPRRLVEPWSLAHDARLYCRCIRQLPDVHRAVVAFFLVTCNSFLLSLVGSFNGGIVGSTLEGIDQESAG